MGNSFESSVDSWYTRTIQKTSRLRTETFRITTVKSSSERSGGMIYILDHYDSFVYNLSAYLQELGETF